MGTLTQKTKARLGGWQRFGIVLSVVWALGAAYSWLSFQTQEADDAAAFASRVCNKLADEAAQRNWVWQHDPNYPNHNEALEDADISKCSEETLETYAIYQQHKWGNSALAALVPLPFAWLLAYIVIVVVRWIKRGFARTKGLQA